MKTFDDWEPKEIFIGSGKGKKIWLENPCNNKEKGFFKYVKTIVKEEKNKRIEVSNTYENVSEKIAELIANEIGIKNAHIDIGTYQRKDGCFSYNLKKYNDDIMNEGIEFITRKYPNYNPETGFDESTGMYYSFEMIMNSLDDRYLQRQFLNMLIFDYLIGNTDRHQSNWAVLKRNEKSKIVLYDNGSSLCSLVPEESIPNYLGNDKTAQEALFVRKSTTWIRINSKNKVKAKHIEMINFLHKNEYLRTKEFVNKVILKLNENKLDLILNQVTEYISDERKKLIKKFLIRKIEDLKKVYKNGR